MLGITTTICTYAFVVLALLRCCCRTGCATLHEGEHFPAAWQVNLFLLCNLDIFAFLGTCPRIHLQPTKKQEGHTAHGRHGNVEAHPRHELGSVVGTPEGVKQKTLRNGPVLRAFGGTQVAELNVAVKVEQFAKLHR